MTKLSESVTNRCQDACSKWSNIKLASFIHNKNYKSLLSCSLTPLQIISRIMYASMITLFGFNTDPKYSIGHKMCNSNLFIFLLKITFFSAVNL